MGADGTRFLRSASLCGLAWLAFKVDGTGGSPCRGRMYYGKLSMVFLGGCVDLPWLTFRVNGREEVLCEGDVLRQAELKIVFVLKVCTG